MGNVLLIAKVMLPGKLILSARAGFDGEDAASADNVLELRANVPAALPAPLTPPEQPQAHPLLKLLPSYVTTTDQLAAAMLRAARHGAPKAVLENKDIVALGKER